MVKNAQKHIDKIRNNEFRPLKVCFNNKSDKESVLRNLHKLKTCSDLKIKGLSIGHDLSETDRKLYKEKVDEAKRLSTDTDFWVVRGPPGAPRLVKRDRRQIN